LRLKKNISKTFWLLSCVLLLHHNLSGQLVPDERAYRVVKTREVIKLDGRLNESTWSSTSMGGGFTQVFPTDTDPAQDSTSFAIRYDDNFLYVGVICFDGLPGKPITNTLRRDFNWPRNDNISFYVDPYNDKSNGFTFQVTYDNVQREGLIVLGGSIRSEWDNIWYSEVYHGEGFWSVEMKIPFKSIRYNANSNWNIQFIRNNQKRNERTTWVRVPQQFQPSDMVYSGKLIWESPPPPAGKNISLIPYFATSYVRDFENDVKDESSLDAGFDAKVGLSNSLNLDLTINPDFSQVEVDQQVTNLQRFEISFPERRQFFLENQDLFADNGFSSTRPFFSRRIGIQGSGSSQRNVPIIAGARLSGKMGSKWRVGVLNVITNKDEIQNSEDIDANISPAQNYAVAVLEKQIFSRSRLSATFVGRNNLGKAAIDSFRVENDRVFNEQGNEINPEDTLFTLSEYNYVYGLDYNLATADNRWEGTTFYHRSVDPDKQNSNYATGAFLQHQTTEFNLRGFFLSVGENYNAEVGFVRRTGIHRAGGRFDYNFFTEGAVQRHGPSIGGSQVLNIKGNTLDKEVSGSWEWRFLNSAEAEVGFQWQSIKLTNSFDPSGSDGLELSEGSLFEFTSFSASFRSDNRKTFFYELEGRKGTYFNGRRWSLNGSANFRHQPVLQVGLNFEYNNISLPSPYNDAELVLLGPRISYTISNEVFFTSFIQYNTQDNNFSQNHRFQWRFEPVSDLFIVYSDNYLTTPGFEARNRSLIIKISYWFNS